MRISDWSSDVCSSDLLGSGMAVARAAEQQANLDRVLAMYREVLIAMDPDAVDRHLPQHYVQHSSLADPGLDALKAFRSEERRVGQECVSTCRSRWSPYH